MLAVDVEKQLGAFQVAVKFEAVGGATALFGPSGAGKTSLVNMIAGLLTPDRGSIALDDIVLFDGARGINVPPHRRRIGYVFQEGRLFPHLNVRQNLDYGRRMSGRARDAKAFGRIADLLDVAHLLDRRPRMLSGGERQRVAVGRALLMHPHLLLLDEPLASLDAARKQEILPYLIRLRDDGGVPIVYVSHTAAEVRRIATAIVRLDGGRVVAVGGTELLKIIRRGGSSIDRFERPELRRPAKFALNNDVLSSTFDRRLGSANGSFHRRSRSNMPAVWGMLCGAGSALFWAFGFVAARHGILAGVSPLVLALHRFIWPGLSLSFQWSPPAVSPISAAWVGAAGSC